MDDAWDDEGTANKVHFFLVRLTFRGSLFDINLTAKLTSCLLLLALWIWSR